MGYIFAGFIFWSVVTCWLIASMLRTVGAIDCQDELAEAGGVDESLVETAKW